MSLFSGKTGFNEWSVIPFAITAVNLYGYPDYSDINTEGAVTLTVPSQP
jgi:hypothetical protein